MAAYCSTISGFTPELMNSSAVVIKYLIGEDGSLITPNQSPNSLEDNKNNFIPGERIIINTPSTAGSTETQYRKILYGGKRIEPILYTQIGHSPAAFSSSIDFTTNFITSLAVGNYQAISIQEVAASSLFNVGQSLSFPQSISGLNLNNNIFIGAQASAWSSNAYTINSDIITEGIALNIEFNINIQYYDPVHDVNHTIRLFLYKEDASGNIVTLDIFESSEYLPVPDFVTIQSNNSNPAFPFAGQQFPIPNTPLSAVLTPGEMAVGDKIYVSGHHICSSYATNDLMYNGAKITINQDPSPTTTNITSSGTNTIWGYPDTSKLYAITCSNDDLTSLYDSHFFQKDITNSGFNKITIPWSIKDGDEFRFEGNENFSYMVKKVYNVNETDIERVSTTGSIEVQFGSPGKSTGIGGHGIRDLVASQSINLDHFLIRRYSTRIFYPIIK